MADVTATRPTMTEENFDRLLNVCKTLINDFHDLALMLKPLTVDKKPCTRAAELIWAAQEAVARAEGDLLRGGRPW